MTWKYITLYYLIFFYTNFLASPFVPVHIKFTCVFYLYSPTLYCAFHYLFFPYSPRITSSLRYLPSFSFNKCSIISFSLVTSISSLHQSFFRRSQFFFLSCRSFHRLTSFHPTPIFTPFTSSFTISLEVARLAPLPPFPRSLTSPKPDRVRGVIVGTLSQS